LEVSPLILTLALLLQPTEPAPLPTALPDMRQVRDTAGNLLEVVTDTANRIILSRRLGGARQ
jgi:hypothetical protein